MRKLLLIPLLLLMSSIGITQYRIVKPLGATGGIETRYIISDYIGLRYSPIRYIHAHTGDIVSLTAEYANISRLTAIGESISTASLALDTIEPYLSHGISANGAISLDIIPQRHTNLYIGTQLRPVTEVNADVINAREINVSGGTISGSGDTGWDHCPMYPNTTFYRYTANDSVEFALSFDYLNSKNYLEAYSTSSGSSIQTADVVIQRKVPNQPNVQSGWLTLSYNTMTADTNISYIRVKAYLDTSRVFTTSRIASKVATVWYDTTLTANSYITGLKSTDNLIVRIEVGVKRYTTNTWVYLGRIKIALE